MSKSKKTDKTIPQTDFEKGVAPIVTHQQILKINPMALVSLFLENNKIGVKKGIPAGTRYVGGGYDAATNTFFLHVENNNFEPIEVGQTLPRVDIQLVDLNVSPLEEKTNEQTS